MPHGPFALDDTDAYCRWRDVRLAAAPGRAEDLVVEVRDLARPSPAERAALLDRCRRANMAVFVTSGGGGGDEARDALRRFAAGFGLERLDANTLADDDGITPLAVAAEGQRRRYIPYTDRPISWHTDGYYNALDRQVRGLVLYCARDAALGGANELLDHEIAYIRLRERDPVLVAALMQADAMTIPGNHDGAIDRPDRSGPVFAVDPVDGGLHMRYTARARNVAWKDDAAVRAAVAALEDVLASDPHVIRHTLRPGQGLLSNNVLHNRAGFTDDPTHGARLLYRARYFDRIAGTTAPV